MKQILVCCFILFSSAAFTQIQTRALKNNDIIKMTLRKEAFQYPANINIGSITIMDSRNDTTSMGYSPEKKAKKYCFKAGFINEMNNWFSQYLKIPAGNAYGPRLFVNIKKLRVSDAVVPKIKENGDPGQLKNGWEKGVVIKVEYFLQKDSLFTPLYRFDSIIPLRGGLERYAEEFIEIALRASLVKLYTIKTDNTLLSRNKILLRDIQRANKQGYNLPIYDSTNLKKGVYKNFDDFKKNIVSSTDFEIKAGEMGDIIYIKENGSEYPSRNLWGFCDGKNLYINSGNKYSQLIRTGYNFYFAGIREISRTTEHIFLLSSGLNYATNTGPKKTSFNLDMKYFQLDMDNGSVY